MLKTLDILQKGVWRGKYHEHVTQCLQLVQSTQALWHLAIETTNFPKSSNILGISYWNLLPVLLAQQIPLLLEHQGMMPSQLSQAFLTDKFLLFSSPNKRKTLCLLKIINNRVFIFYYFKA